MALAALRDAPARASRRGRPGFEAAFLRLPAFAALVLGVVLAAMDAGFQETAWYPAGLFLLALLVVVLVVAAPKRSAIDRAFAVAVACLTAYTAWGYLSMLWADVPATAWDGANRTLVVAVAVALVGLRPWPPRLADVALGVVGGGIAVIGAITLARSGGDTAALFLGGRLGEPAGYSNAAAAVWLIGFWCTLHVALVRRAWPPVRGAGIAAATLLLGLGLLTQSRGAAAAFVITAAVFLVLHTRRWPALAGLVLAALLVGIAWDPLVEVRLATDTDDLARRMGEAREALLTVTLIAFAIGTLTTFITGVLWRGRGVPRRARRAGDRAFLGAAAIVAVAGVVLLASSGGWIEDRWDDFRTTDYSAVEGSRTRFTGSLGSGRYDFYRVALREFRANPVGGVGADNFGVQYLIDRRTGEAPRYAHSLGFEVLAQLGVVGALLLAGFLAALGAGVARVRRREDEAAGAAAVAGLAAGLAFLLHGMTDWLWQFTALPILGLAVLTIGARIRSEPPSVGDRESWGPPTPRRRVLAVAAALLTIAAGISLALPGASIRVQRAALDAQLEDPDTTLARLQRAAELNPLSADPVLARAVLARRLGRREIADRAIAEAVRREDRTWLVHFEAALFAAEAGRTPEALAALARAAELNPQQPVIPDVRRRLEQGRRVDADAVEAELSGQLARKIAPVDPNQRGATTP